MILRTVIILVASSFAGACSTPASDPTAASSAAPSSASTLAGLAEGITRVEDPSLVCMVNDTFMGRPQIPVEVAGKTYFGCCAMCEGRLKGEPGVRTAVDPVTGEAVDKATAVLAQDASGAILYFTSEANLAGYRPPR